MKGDFMAGMSHEQSHGSALHRRLEIRHAIPFRNARAGSITQATRLLTRGRLRRIVRRRACPRIFFSA
jgi:hypothetical protein